jgi:hypothetical protein
MSGKIEAIKSRPDTWAAAPAPTTPGATRMILVGLTCPGQAFPMLRSIMLDFRDVAEHPGSQRKSVPAVRTRATYTSRVDDWLLGTADTHDEDVGLE